MRTFSLFTAAVALILLLFPSCDPQRVYEENQAIPAEGWRKDNPLYFSLNVNDTTSVHNIYVNIRNSGKYENRNLYLFITTTAPAGQSVTDTLECFLADERGKWYGSGLGDLYFVQIPYKMAVVFPYSGLYRFEIVQAMRRDVLRNIADVGIRVEKVEP